MKRYETLETLLENVDLSFAETVLKEAYHPEDSPGRPPRNPLGIFKAHLLRRLRHVPSDRMLVRQLWKDPRLKRLCDIEADEPRYGIAVLSRFRSKVGPERLMCIRKRVAVERAFSRLKNLTGLTQHNLRGLAKITFHSQLCILAMLLTAQAAVNTRKTGKSRSIRYFAN
jgi:hypothetical protein